MRYACLIALSMIAAVSQGAVETQKPVEELLWPQGVMDKGIVHKEAEETNVRFSETSGKAMGGATRVSVPTMTIFPAPKDKATRAAVVVFPGGGYRNVVLGKEGWDVARRLNEMGIMAAVVKYRTMPTEPNGRINWEKNQGSLPLIISDGERAVRMVRSRAAELGIDPNKIGTMGFSAGAHLAGSVMLEADAGSNSANDPVEKISSRPDFTCMIYGGFDNEKFDKAKVPIGPCFLAIAANDDKVQPGEILKSFEMLRKAGVPAELHVFQSGGHGFGVGRTTGTETEWLKVLEVWLKQNGFHR
jgi:acetyl esterase/lipase